MAIALEDVRVLQVAERLADTIWKHVLAWEPFARQTVGQQLTRAADSIGANIAEAFGRFHYSEKVQFLYYARGSLFETKYWLNRASARGLINSAEAEEHGSRLNQVARQLNSFVASLKTQRADGRRPAVAVREPPTIYRTDDVTDEDALFAEDDLIWLETSRANP